MTAQRIKAKQITRYLPLLLLLTLSLTTTVLASREQERCLESWYQDDLPLLTSNEGWNIIETRQNITTYWRESMTSAHIARVHKAVMYNIPASVEEVFTKWHTNRFSTANLKSLPFLQEGKIIEEYGENSDLVYEQHQTPSYLSLYYPIADRDWLYNRCVKKIGESYLISYRSEFDDRMPNMTNYMRGWLIDSAVLISPSPLGKFFTQLTFIRQRSMMCCIPQAAHDTQQAKAIAEELSAFRGTFEGGQGLCDGDYTNWRDDLHASCHLILDFPSSCDKVLNSIQMNVMHNQEEYQTRSVWSNEWCLELIHRSYFFIEDLHFEVSESRPNFCSLRAGSRTRSLSHYDLGENYCNIYNLLQNAGEFSLTVDNCLYRPHSSPQRFCNGQATFVDYLCTFDFFEYFCK